MTARSSEYFPGEFWLTVVPEEEPPWWVAATEALASKKQKKKGMFDRLNNEPSDIVTSFKQLLTLSGLLCFVFHLFSRKYCTRDISVKKKWLNAMRAAKTCGIHYKEKKMGEGEVSYRLRKRVERASRSLCKWASWPVCGSVRKYEFHKNLWNDWNQNVEAIVLKIKVRVQKSRSRGVDF